MEQGRSAESGGQVRSVYRYPVKSMLGESLTTAAVTERGIEGDRRVAVLDLETGRVASAKNPRLWAGLLACQASTREGQTEIALADGTRIAIDGAGAEVLSRVIGRRIRFAVVPPADATLERSDPIEVLEKGAASPVAVSLTKLGAGAPPGTFFDFAPVHLVATSTISAIEKETGRPVDPIRYRPNLVIDVPRDTPPFVENGWVGRQLRVGGVLMKILVPTPRCAVPTLAHGAAAPMPEALRSVVRRNRIPVLTLGHLPCLGCYAQVIESGEIREGDEARFTG